MRSGLNSWRMVWDGRYKLITGFDEHIEKGQGKLDAKTTSPILFDHERDPRENENAAAREEQQVTRLTALIA